MTQKLHSKVLTQQKVKQLKAMKTYTQVTAAAWFIIDEK